MKAVRDAWNEIEKALGARARKMLRPPASAQACAALERALERKLPRALRASLAIHDGGAANQPLWLNEQLLGTVAVGRRARMMNDFVRDGDFGTDHWNPSWIPLTDADGDGFCLDTSDGCVVRFRNTGGHRTVAANFAAWLASIPVRVEAEAKAERDTNALLSAGVAAGTKRERDRLARIDRELPFFVSFVDDLRARKLASTRERVLRFRPIGRVAAQVVLDRGLERGFLAQRGSAISVTALGRRLLRAAFGNASIRL